MFITKAARYMLSLVSRGGNLTFSSPTAAHRIRGVYNPDLIDKVGIENPASSDVNMDSDERIFILTGPNSGGKTVYLNSFGIAQILFRLGLSIPAKSAEMKPMREILTVSVKNSGTSHDGRLASEVARLKICLEKANSDTLFLLDETFSSTSAFDGVFLAESLLKYLSKSLAH